MISKQFLTHTIHAILIAAAIVPAAFAQSVSTSEYLPLSVNRTWHYIDTAAGSIEFDLKVQEQTTAEGQPAFREFRIGMDEWDLMSNDAKGLRLHGRKDRNGTIPWTPAVVFAPAKATVGEVYTSTPDYLNPGTHNKMIWTSKFEKVTDVTVPAGTFKDCVQLKVSINDAVLGTRFANFDMYLAKGVGIVKRQGQFFGLFFAQLLMKSSAQ